MIELRPAFRKDAGDIRTLIHQVNINPLGLDWHRFIVAVDEEDKIVGCGQIKPHRDGTHELASIAVLPEYRHQGIASDIITKLLKQEKPPIYLTCRSPLRSFYQKFGFEVVPDQELPRYFLRIVRLFAIMKKIFSLEHELLVMVKNAMA